MKYSFAITTHNEGQYIDKLLSQIADYPNSEIVILDDISAEPDTVEILKKWKESEKVSVYTKKFSADFSEHKNYLNGKCKGDYIFQLDADETMAPYLLANLDMVTKTHPRTDLFVVPRVNTITDLTDEHIKRWQWNVNEKGWINWPDYQTRFYRNAPGIKWEGRVHERIRGYSVWTPLPDQEEYAIFHSKDILRQEKQNRLYDLFARIQ